MDDFSKAPISLGEYKANKSNDPKDITVRDNLVALLRLIDEGHINPVKGIMVMYDEEAEEVHVFRANCLEFEARGLAAEV